MPAGYGRSRYAAWPDGGCLSKPSLKLIGLSLLGIGVGYLVANLTAAERELSRAGPLKCGGPALVISPFPGANAHGLTLFVGGVSKGQPVEVSLEGFQSRRSLLFTSAAEMSDAFYYSGRWTGPATIEARSEGGDCLLDVAFRFRSALAVR